MHPDAREGDAAVGAGALGKLVLVVGEDQIDAAAVDVDALAEMDFGHRRAFDVPARTAPSPGAVPARLGFVRGLPQDEIGRVLLVGRDLDPGAGDHLLAVAPRQRAVAFEFRYVEQHMRFRLVGMALRDKRFDHGDDLRDVLGHPGLDARLQHAQRAHIPVVGRGVALVDHRDIDAFGERRIVDLVVDIGDVAGVDDVVVAPAQHPVEHVEDDRRPGIADMGEAVDRRPADIHRHPPRIAGHELVLLLREGVVEAQGHGAFGLHVALRPF